MTNEPQKKPYLSSVTCWIKFAAGFCLYAFMAHMDIINENDLDGWLYLAPAYLMSGLTPKEVGEIVKSWRGK